ncbi:MAG: hypothetical protein ACOY17_09455 [Pseudomonadota bacterium]
MSSALNITLSGLRGAETRFAVRAENIANAGVSGYAPQRAEQVSTATGPVVRVSRTEKPRQERQNEEAVNLAEEIAGLIAAKQDYKTAIAVLRIEQEVRGALLDILV